MIFWFLIAFVSGFCAVVLGWLIVEDSLLWLPTIYEGGRLRMFLRMVRRAYEVESARFVWEQWKPRGRIRGFFVVCRMLYPMFRITGQQYWNTEVWYHTFAPDEWRPMLIGKSTFSNAYTARLWDYQQKVELVDYCYGYECRWRGWVIPVECLWGNMLPDPSDAHAEKVRLDLERDVF
jgi:hypothetical protein